MKHIAPVFVFLSVAVTASYGGSPFAFSGSSGEFVVDTRPDVIINDVTSPYFSGAYGGQGGTKQTFISGVRCDIELTVHASGRDNNPINYYLVNGQRHDSPNFTFNVGSLSPGDRLTVIAVDYLEKKSKPFRVNLEIATAPPMWASAYLSQIVADQFPREHRVVYRAPEYRGFSLFDAYSDAVELGEDDDPLNLDLALTPTLKLWQRMDSSTGQYCEGADAGLSGGNYGRIENKIGRFGGLSISAALTGGSVYQYYPSRSAWIMNSGELGVQYSGSWKVRQRLPQCPLIYLEIGLSSSGSFVMRERNGEWSTDLSLKPLIAITAAAGIGVDVLAQAEVSGQIGLYLEAKVPGGLESIILNGQVSWRAVLIGFEWTGTWWEGNLYLYPWGGPRGSKFRLLNAGLYDVAMKGDGFKPISRKYGDGVAPIMRRAPGLRLLNALPGSDNTQILMCDGYPTPQPTLAVVETNAVVVYVRDNAIRSDLDRTELVFREEGSDGLWGGESHVWDDGTADFQPKIVLLPDGTAVAAWANAKRTFADGTSFADVCVSLESAVGVRDPQTGVWTCANLTDDAALDWVPVLKGATNGTAAVAWVRNASGAYIGTTAQPSDLAVSFYRNGAWTPMGIAAGNIGAILSHDIAWNGERAVLAWAADADGDLATEDAEIWAKTFENGAWSSPVRLSSQSAAAMRPSVWYLTNGIPHVVWVQNGTLFAADGLTSASGTNVAATAELSIPGDYRVSVRENGSATFLWATDPFASKSGLEGGIVSADYTPGEGLAASATLLKRESAALRNLSGVMDAHGTFRIAYESVAVSTNAEGRLVHGAVDLSVSRRDAVRDVGITADDCSFASFVAIGETNTLLVGIQNYGTVASGTFGYRVWAGEGDDEKMLLASGESNIPPLSREVVEVPWTPAGGMTNVAFTIEVDADNSIGDSNRENNTLVWRPDVGSPSLSFRNAKAVMATDTLRLISARIHNDSVAPVPAGMSVKFWRGEIGGELIGTDSTGIISGGDVGEYDVGIAWNISNVTFTSEWERVVIELPTEQGGQSVAVWTPTPLYDPENDIGGGGSGGGGSGGGGDTPSAPPNIGGITGFGVVDGSRCFNFYFYGEEGFTYLVQYKERLSDAEWTTIETFVPSATGECPVAVPIITSAPSGFYRVVTSQ